MNFFAFLIGAVLGAITYDSGYFLDFEIDTVPTFVCLEGFSTTSTINFASAFANPPQIILTLDKEDVQKTYSEITHSYQQLEMLFQIQSVTTTSFQLFIKCPAAKTHNLRYRWYAIDDQRIQVINQFNIANIQNDTLDHQNPNAVAGFVSLISFGYKGAFNFVMSIDYITSTKVKILITDPKSLLSNILTLGYQIILAAPEAINVLSTIYKTATWTSSDIPVVADTFFLLPVVGYDQTNQNNFRLRVIYQSTNPIRYKLENWYGPYIPNTHQQVQLKYKFITYLPFYCNHLRTSQKFNPSISELETLSVEIFEIGKMYTQIGTNSIILENTSSIVNFAITAACEENENVYSSILMYPNRVGQQQMKSQTHYCNQFKNMITHHVRLAQQLISAAELKIDITSTQVQISQILYNQVKSTQIILIVQIVNK